MIWRPLNQKVRMPLTIGSRLGPYEVVAPLGAGAMSEVYKARDTRLDRFVAIKVLPAAVADDVQRRERFRREAHAISNLAAMHVARLATVALFLIHIATNASAQVGQGRLIGSVTDAQHAVLPR